MNQEDIKAINFDLPKNRSNVIKVIGVGGGGSNAINYMFQQGIKGVDFIITNTDAQALSESGVPTKIQLGATLTEGLGAGANPEVGARAAQESKDEIHSVLSIQTKMPYFYVKTLLTNFFYQPSYAYAHLAIPCVVATKAFTQS